MTIARAETSTHLQSPEPQETASKGMSVALIGPNDAHRRVVAHALSSAQGRKVHEFNDYPADLTDLARMMETKFDFVLVDVDTDESYALEIIAKLADFGPSVMAYSARSDQELLASCMRAGAVDFLPLPSENGAPAEAAPQPPTAPPVQQIVPKVSAPKPAPTPSASTARSNFTSVLPERREEFVRDTRPPAPAEERFAAPPAKMYEPPITSAPVEEQQPENESDDFAAWDKANLRPATPIPITKGGESRRPSLVPDRRRTEVAPRSAPDVEETAAAPAPPIERPPVQVGIFRSAELHSEPSEASEKQGANWLKWILIGAGPAVVGLVLLIVFTRPSTPNSSASAALASAASAKQGPAAANSVEPPVQPGSQRIVDATGKPGSTALISSAAKPSPAVQESAQAEPEAAPVSPDAMAEQLVAPTRIAGTIKKAPAADEPPPAPVSVPLADNSAISGAIFDSNAKAKYVPKVVAISAGVADGMIIRKTPPLYPRFAQEARISGKVVLKATITKQGTIEGVQVLSGPKVLAPSAVDAVKTWKYRPYMLDSQPVAVETTITVLFGMGK